MTDTRNDGRRRGGAAGVQPHLVLHRCGNERLTAAQQAEYVRLLARGASPAAACTALDVTLETVDAALEADREFRRRVQQAEVMLSQNVVAALYRKAIEGNVPAQTFFLRHRPPPEWQAPHRSHLSDEDAERLSDEELQELLRS